MGFNIRRFISSINQMMLIIYVSIFLLTTYFIVSEYFHFITESKNNKLEKLEVAARTLSNEIDYHCIEYLIEKYQFKDEIKHPEQDSTYFTIHNQLKTYAKINELSSPIYLLWYDSRQRNFEFLVTSGDKPFFRYTYPDFPKELELNFKNGGTLSDYKTKTGRWISAYSPVKDNEGKTLAVIHVDYEYSRYIGEARSKLLKNLLISLGVIAVITFLLYRTIDPLIKKQKNFQELLVSKNKEITARNEEIQAQHEEISSQNENISKSNSELEKTKEALEVKNTELENTNKFLDEKVKERTIELEGAIDNLDNFLYRSYHDILGPVATLKGLSELSKIDIKDEVANDYIRKFDNIIENLGQSIRNINAVYEIKNRHFYGEKIEVKTFLEGLIKKQAYLLQIRIPPVELNLDASLVVYSDIYFLELMMSDLIRNIMLTAKNKPIKPMKITGEVIADNYLKLWITDPGSNKLFFNSYLQVHDKDLVDVNHNVYIFHNSLKKLEARILNVSEDKGPEVMEIIIPFIKS